MSQSNSGHFVIVRVICGIQWPSHKRTARHLQSLVMFSLDFTGILHSHVNH